MNNRTADSVPLIVRGFLLASVVCLHAVGAMALLRLSGLPQHNEAPAVLRASWIVPPPSLLPSPVVKPVEPPVRQPPLPRPAPSPPKTVVQPSPAPAAVDIPPAPTEPALQNDSIPTPRIDAPAAVATATGETVAEEDGSYVDPDFNVSYFSNPEPAYPSLSRRLREQGLVKLRVHVTVEGHADEVTLHTSSGYERLDKAALNAVKRWRFRPAQRAGTPVAGWVIVPVRFELQG